MPMPMHCSGLIAYLRGRPHSASSVTAAAPAPAPAPVRKMQAAVGMVGLPGRRRMQRGKAALVQDEGTRLPALLAKALHSAGCCLQ